MKFLKTGRFFLAVWLFFFFLLNLNLSLLFWHYLHLIIYPFFWLIFFHHQKRGWWLGSLLLSLIADYYLGLPLGFNGLMMALLEFVSYWLESFHRSLGRLYLFFGLLGLDFFLLFFWLLFLPHFWLTLFFHLLLSDILLVLLIRLNVDEL